MDTPIADFLRHYRDDRMVRFHMPGHKGKSVLGCEALDITEVKGADALYEADGIIAESERNAAALFGSRRTCYATEGSSQCIRAMLYLALTHHTAEGRPVVVAARNVHKAFVYAAAMLDFDVAWLWPEQQNSLCGCPVSAEQLEDVLAGLKNPPAAVYLTSPDYLGGMADIPALAEVAHCYGAILIVDNAHGAYLRSLYPSLHPLDLGADLCCDSAHKTLPVLTGGAYLHISKHLPEEYADHAKLAMALFGSTSPSYLTMASLDLCNRYLEECGSRMEACVKEIQNVKSRLRSANWQIEESDPLRITICAPEGETGQSLAERLREERIECEYADDTHLVLMATPENAAEELEAVVSVLGKSPAEKRVLPSLPIARGEQAVSIRQALFAPHELVSAERALGRICGTPTVSCPPAIPIAVSGERITAETLELFRYYGVNEIDVLK
jgi:arginine/lysine/ornithine decarboxylase